MRTLTLACALVLSAVPAAGQDVHRELESRRQAWQREGGVEGGLEVLEWAAERVGALSKGDRFLFDQGREHLVREVLRCAVEAADPIDVEALEPIRKRLEACTVRPGASLDLVFAAAERAPLDEDVTEWFGRVLDEVLPASPDDRRARASRSGTLLIRYEMGARRAKDPLLLVELADLLARFEAEYGDDLRQPSLPTTSGLYREALELAPNDDRVWGLLERLWKKEGEALREAVRKVEEWPAGARIRFPEHGLNERTAARADFGEDFRRSPRPAFRSRSSASDPWEYEAGPPAGGSDGAEAWECIMVCPVVGVAGQSATHTTVILGEPIPAWEERRWDDEAGIWTWPTRKMRRDEVTLDVTPWMEKLAAWQAELAEKDARRDAARAEWDGAERELESLVEERAELREIDEVRVRRRRAAEVLKSAVEIADTKAWVVAYLTSIHARIDDAVAAGGSREEFETLATRLGVRSLERPAGAEAPPSAEAPPEPEAEAADESEEGGWLRVAMAAEAKGDRAFAARIYRRIVDRHPGTPAAAKAAERLDALGPDPKD